MAAPATDHFQETMGSRRGSHREPSDDPEVVLASERRKRILALVAAHGILGHNSAVSMPEDFGAGQIAALCEHGGQPDQPSSVEPDEVLMADLRALTNAGFLYRFESQSGRETWKVKPAGLVELWTGAWAPEL
jgi:hypothetical protein